MSQVARQKATISTLNMSSLNRTMDAPIAIVAMWKYLALLVHGSSMSA
jgi:hypothetical protein